MNNMNLMIKMYNNEKKGKLPEQAHPTDAGFDVQYPGETPIQISSRQTVLIDLHITFKIPVGT
ncbi:2193_t:CDS:1, partial [Ambispora gerdemannii]